MTRVAMMGSGSWGTAFAIVLAHAGCDVTIWSRDDKTVEQISTIHQNRTYHPGVELPESIHATLSASEALGEADFVVLAIPAQAVRSNLLQWKADVPESAVVVSLIKGIEIGTTMRMSQVISETLGTPKEQIAVISGPNLAREIVQRQPTASTVACVDPQTAKTVQAVCTTNYFRPYWTTDVIGTEIGGSVKNVIAVANGMAVGMGLGENSQASLITRGLAEMARLGVALGADPLTFQGLAGVGDLVATCQSSLSRNRTFGENIGSGLTVEETIEITRQTCEAYKSCTPIWDLAQEHGVEMPITEQVVNVLHHGHSPTVMAAAFMARDTRAETDLRL